MMFSFFWPLPHLVSVGWLCPFAEGLSCHRWPSPQAHHLSCPETSLSLWPFRPTGGPAALFKHCPASRNTPSPSAKCGRASSPAGSPASCLASACPPLTGHQLCGARHCLCSLLTHLGSPQGLTHTEYSVNCPLNERARPQVCTHMCSCRQTDTLTHTHTKASTACGSLESSEL